MEFANNLILLGAGLITLSIFAGLVSSRIGAPLLLVFLALGLLAGEDGPGGIPFSDFNAAYIAGSIALAIILFDGGLRTSRQNLRSAGLPALILATAGVLLTALLCDVFAMWAFDFNFVEGLLVGSIVASTDAAAVFFLLHLHGLRLKDRVGATLEVESGLNDPMAIFLTVLCVGLLQSGVRDLTWASADDLVVEFVIQIAGGAAFGLIGGWLLLQIINRLEIASGLYPIFALAFAMTIFAVAQSIHASGFMAIYIVGLILGNRRHRATQVINRFHDGLAWLSQIMMFLMLGLLATPHQILPHLLPALAFAIFLIVVARPIAVLLCLLPFGYDRREVGFISWVGLRGAVPIYLGTIPVLTDVPGAHTFFAVAFVVVLMSLLVQGWTVMFAARQFGLERPPRPPAPLRADLDLPGRTDRDMAAYTVQPFSMATRRRLERLPLPDGVNIVSIIRDGVLQESKNIQRLAPGDYVLLIAPGEEMPLLDRFFAARNQRSGRSRPDEMIGEFVLDAGANLGEVADLYDFRLPRALRSFTVGDFLQRSLLKSPPLGRRLHIGEVAFIVRAVESGRVTRVGLDVAPPTSARNWQDLFRIAIVMVSEPLRRTRHRRQTGESDA
jgi:cell volume regulation protein A